jgi:hypothetical protein
MQSGYICLFCYSDCASAERTCRTGLRQGSGRGAKEAARLCLVSSDIENPCDFKNVLLQAGFRPLIATSVLLRIVEYWHA